MKKLFLFICIQITRIGNIPLFAQRKIKNDTKEFIEFLMQDFVFF